MTAHDPAILLVTPPPIDEIKCEIEDTKKGYSQVTRYQSVTAQYADSVRVVAEVAAKSGRNVALVDLWKVMMEEAVRLTSGYIDQREVRERSFYSRADWIELDDGNLCCFQRQVYQIPRDFQQSSPSNRLVLKWNHCIVALFVHIVFAN